MIAATNDELGLYTYVETVLQTYTQARLDAIQAQHGFSLTWPTADQAYFRDVEPSYTMRDPIVIGMTSTQTTEELRLSMSKVLTTMTVRVGVIGRGAGLPDDRTSVSQALALLTDAAAWTLQKYARGGTAGVYNCRRDRKTAGRRVTGKMGNAGFGGFREFSVTFTQQQTIT